MTLAAEFIILGQMAEPYNAAVFHMSLVEPMGAHRFLKGVREQWQELQRPLRLVVVADRHLNTTPAQLRILQQAVGLAGFAVVGVMGEERSAWAAAMKCPEVVEKPRLAIDHAAMHRRRLFLEQLDAKVIAPIPERCVDMSSVGDVLTSEGAQISEQTAADQSTPDSPQQGVENITIDDAENGENPIHKHADECSVLSIQRDDTEIVHTKQTALYDLSMQRDGAHISPVQSTELNAGLDGTVSDLERLHSLVSNCLSKVEAVAERRNTYRAEHAADVAPETDVAANVYVAEVFAVEQDAFDLHTSKMHERPLDDTAAQTNTCVAEDTPFMPLRETFAFSEQQDAEGGAFTTDDTRIENDAPQHSGATNVVLGSWGAGGGTDSTGEVSLWAPQPLADILPNPSPDEDVSRDQAVKQAGVDGGEHAAFAVVESTTNSRAAALQTVAAAEDSLTLGGAERGVGGSTNIEAVHKHDVIGNVDIPPTASNLELPYLMRIAEEQRTSKRSVAVGGNAKPLRHHGRLRSGQLLMHAGDVVVEGSTHPSSEVVAYGDIHVYGTGGGRLLAGVGGTGNEQACIYVQMFDAELVSIAGRHCVFDEILPKWSGRSVKIFLRRGQLCFEELKAMPRLAA